MKVDENQIRATSGQLLHIVARLYTDEPLTEPDYNIQVQAVKLKRRVQMYQWVEEETYGYLYKSMLKFIIIYQKILYLLYSFYYSRESIYGQSIDIINNGQRTYYYTQDWRDKLVDSSLFYIRSGHENPKEFPIKNRILTANHVLIGNYELSAEAKSKIDNYIEITSDTRPEDPAIKLHSGLYYHCNDVFSPEIGDIRLQFLTAGIEGNFVRKNLLNLIFFFQNN